MLGADLHTYFTISPVGVPIPVPATPHAVGSMHRLTRRSWHDTANVHCDGGDFMIQEGWAMIVVAHFPVTLVPPHPAMEPAALLATIAGAFSQPQLTVHSVKNAGASLMACLYEAVNLDINCGTQNPLPTGCVYNVSSVKTTPSPGDYMRAAVVGLLNGLISAGAASLPLGWAPGISLARSFLDSYHDDPIARLVALIGKSVQQGIDG
jgi:hypothetical protein